MYSNQCDQKLEELQRVLAEYITCLSNSIVKDILTKLSEDISEEFLQRLSEKISVKTSEELRKEIHELFDDEQKLIKKFVDEKYGSSFYSGSESNTTVQKNQNSNVSRNMIMSEPENVKREYFYFVAADNKQRFLDSKKSRIKDKKSVFMFELQDQNRAQVTIVDDADVHKKIILAYDTYLQGIVSSSNTHNVDYTDIKVNNPGIAELEGNEWKMKEKIEITYK